MTRSRLRIVTLLLALPPFLATGAAASHPEQAPAFEEGLRVRLEIALEELRVPTEVTRITEKGDVIIGLASGGLATLSARELDSALERGLSWDAFEFPEQFIEAVRRGQPRVPKANSCIRFLDREAVICDFVCHAVAICYDAGDDAPPNQGDLCTEIQRGCVEKTEALAAQPARAACRPFCLTERAARNLCAACDAHPKFK